MPEPCTLNPDYHIRIVLNQTMVMVFNDPRRFGLMRVGKPSELNELLHVGLDPPWWKTTPPRRSVVSLGHGVYRSRTC